MRKKGIYSTEHTSHYIFVTTSRNYECAFSCVIFTRMKGMRYTYGLVSKNLSGLSYRLQHYFFPQSSYWFPFKKAFSFHPIPVITLHLSWHSLFPKYSHLNVFRKYFNLYFPLPQIYSHSYVACSSQRTFTFLLFSHHHKPLQSWPIRETF